MLSIHVESEVFREINQDFTLAEVATRDQPQPQYYPIEVWGGLGLLGVGFLALARGELKRLDRRRELEAEQAEKYVKELEEENRRLEVELKQMRNTVIGLRVRLAESEKEIQMNSGELRRQRS